MSNIMQRDTMRHVWPAMAMLVVSCTDVTSTELPLSPDDRHIRNNDSRRDRDFVSNEGVEFVQQFYTVYKHRHLSCPPKCEIRTLKTLSFNSALEKCTHTDGCVAVTRKQVHTANSTSDDARDSKGMATTLCTCVERDVEDMVPNRGKGVQFGVENFTWDGAIRKGCESFGPTLAHLLAISGASNKCSQLEEQPQVEKRFNEFLHSNYSLEHGTRAWCEFLTN